MVIKIRASDHALPVKTVLPLLHILPERRELVHVDGAVRVAVEHADEESARLRVEVGPVVVEESLLQLHRRYLARLVRVHRLGKEKKKERKKEEKIE